MIKIELVRDFDGQRHGYIEHAIFVGDQRAGSVKFTPEERLELERLCGTEGISVGQEGSRLDLHMPR